MVDKFHGGSFNRKIELENEVESRKVDQVKKSNKGSFYLIESNIQISFRRQTNYFAQ